MPPVDSTLVMVTSLIISAVRSFSHNFDPNATCVVLPTENWRLIGLGAPVLFSLTVLLHFLQMGFRERAMMPYLFDIVCMGLVTIVLIVMLIVIALDVVSDQVAFVLRTYIIVAIVIVDTRLLLKRARESERVEGIPLPSSSLLNGGGGEDDDLTMETASLESHQSLAITHDQSYYSRNRASVPFGRYEYSYAQSHLEDGKKPELPIVNREVVVALN
ncbi:hypothetical protein Clacol_005090 [Clathrus columnatus]|uniref:Uncharacterized protein n=1 Tax=Clathrus columnatus TaxID=1419009 RepID=A0AAV5A8A5_9AGAM|nr:hypothetical protein Clacol_005090 [Clathrus columnatus]